VNRSGLLSLEFLLSSVFCILSSDK
jgi:hypothetical protein